MRSRGQERNVRLLGRPALTGPFHNTYRGCSHHGGRARKFTVNSRPGPRRSTDSKPPGTPAFLLTRRLRTDAGSGASATTRRILERMVAPPTLRLLTTRDAVTEYLRGVHRAVLGGSLSPATLRNYERDLAEFCELAGPDTVLDSLTAADLDDILLAYAARPDGRFTRRLKTTDEGSPGRGLGAQARFRQSMSRLFSHATRAGWVQVNPIPDMQVKPRVRGVSSVARKALPQRTAVELLDMPAASSRKSRSDQQLAVRDEAILRILVEVGPRVSELCALDRSDVETWDGTTWLHVRRGKGGKSRSLPLSAGTATAVSLWINSPRPAPPAEDIPERQEDAERSLFVSYRGRRMKPRDIQYLVERMSNKLPAAVRRRVTPHGLRHTAATLLLSSGAADIKTVQSLLGHESIATTGVYLDQVSEELVRAVAAHPVTGVRTLGR